MESRHSSFETSDLKSVNQFWGKNFVSAQMLWQEMPGFNCS